MKTHLKEKVSVGLGSEDGCTLLNTPLKQKPKYLLLMTPKMYLTGSGVIVVDRQV